MQRAADAPSGPDSGEPAGSQTSLLETLVSLMPDAAVVVNHEGTIVCLNQQAEHLFDYQAAELLGRSIEQLVPERFRPRHRLHRRNYMVAPRPRAMGAGRDLVGRRRDGTEVAVDISLAPLALSGPPLVVAGIRDATERREFQAAQAQLAAVVRSSHDAILSMEPGGRIVTCNAGAEELFRYPADELVGGHISRLVPDDASPEFEHHLEAALDGLSLGSFDTQWLTRLGERRDVAASVSPLKTDLDQVMGFSVVLRDITERKHAEAEQRRLLAEVRRQERFEASLAEVRLALLSGSTLDEDLSLISGWLCELLEAPAAAVLLLDGPPRVAAGAGTAASLVGQVVERLPPGLAGRGADEIERELPQGLPESAAQPSFSGVFSGVPVLVAPVQADGRVKGLILVAAGDSPHGHDQVAMETMSKEASLALALTQARADRERLVVVEDRERIARDLHDQVIQRLFAAGMGLQAVLPRVGDARATERISEIVDGLDKAIGEIRTTIFRLGPTARRHGVRAEILEVAEEASRPLGFAPKVVFDGPIDAAVSARLAPHVLAVIREALANAARHAHATSVDVEVVVDGQLRVTVADNGVGLGSSQRRSGLANLRSRADELGGRLELRPNPGGGTRLEWSAPLDD